MAKPSPARMLAEAFERAFEHFATKDDLKKFTTKEDLARVETRLDQIIQLIQSQQGQIQVLTQIITGQVKRSGTSGNGD